MTHASIADSADDLIISPELALVDPELAARARALEALPDDVEAEDEPAEAEPAPADDHRAGGAPWPLLVLLSVSVALNVVGFRYLLDDGISPQSVFQSQPATTGTTTTATAGGSVLGAQFPRASTVPSAPRPKPLPEMTATDVQVRLLTRLGTKPQLRTRFLDASGIPLPGVSDRCKRLTAQRTVLAFRCVVWRQPGSIKNGTSVEVHVTGPKTLRVTAVG